MNAPLEGHQGSEETDQVELSVPLSADMLAALRVALFQRRSLGDDSAALADLVKEAVSEWLEREIDETTRFSIRV